MSSGNAAIPSMTASGNAVPSCATHPVRPICIPANRLETHFVFYYDLKVRIQSYWSSQPNASVAGWTWESPDDWRLGAYYSDKFASRLIAAQFWAQAATFKSVISIQATSAGLGSSARPSGSSTLYDFSPYENPATGCRSLECTLFRNGILAVTVRLTNIPDIDDRTYVEMIARPERFGMPSSPGGGAGPLIQKVYSDILRHAEPSIADCINALSLVVHSLTDPSSGQLNIGASGMPSAGLVRRELHPSRPYVGTVVSLSTTPGHASDHVARFAIACARTTPAFLDQFKDPEQYLNEGEPRRNIYYPGPSIVFIARRGWVCLEMEQRIHSDTFRLGVVRNVLFVIQATDTSARAARRFLTDLIGRGSDMVNELARSRQPKYWRAVLSRIWRGPWTSWVRRFTAFMVDARMSSPFDDLSSQLRSHTITHTGIAAAGRIRELTDYDEVADSAKRLIDGYSGFLESQSLLKTRQSIVVAVAAIIIGAILQIVELLI